MLLLRLLSIGLFALLVASQDDGQPSDGVLNNMDGKTPCDMKEMFVQSCLPPQARDDNDPDTTPTPPPSPTPCICTNVFFNLWSACVYITHGNASLPVCESLQQNCTQASIDITTKPFQSNASYPKWVYMDLPANGTFNLAAAVESADGSQSHKWTTIQVVVPIIVFVVVVALGVGFFLYRRRRHANRQRPWMQTTGNRPRFHFPTLSSLQRVRELDRSSSWSIEEREEGLQEYQFVSYPSSLQGSRASGHVRLSSSSSGTLPGPPPLKIPSEKNKAPVWTWPGKSIWKGPLQSVQQLGDSIPRPWRATKRVAVKNIPGYRKFRVDGADSDSPLSQRPHAQSLLGHPERSRTNLHNETIFERENEDSDSDEEGLPLIAQEHSRSNHDAEPPANAARMISPPSGRESPGESNSSQRTARQKVPPASSPPRIPLPLPPPTPTQRPPPSPASSQQQPVRTQEPPRSAPPRPAPPPPISSASPQSVASPQSAARSPRPPPNLPPHPTSPPPPPPTFPKRSPRSPRTPLPTQFANQQPLPSPPLLSPPPSNRAPAPPAPRRRPDSDGGSSIRSLPMTPTPPYVRATPAPIQVEGEPTAGNTPPHSAPPYAPTVPPPPADSTRSVRSGSEAARSVRRLPLPPGQWQ